MLTTAPNRVTRQPAGIKIIPFGKLPILNRVRDGLVKLTLLGGGSEKDKRPGPRPHAIPSRGFNASWRPLLQTQQDGTPRSGRGETHQCRLRSRLPGGYSCAAFCICRCCKPELCVAGIDIGIVLMTNVVSFIFLSFHCVFSGLSLRTEGNRHGRRRRRSVLWEFQYFKQMHPSPINKMRAVNPK